MALPKLLTIPLLRTTTTLPPRLSLKTAKCLSRPEKLALYSMASKTTVSDTIREDHRAIESAYTEVVYSSDQEHQTRYGNQFTWELARHSIAEELIIYPAFEKYLGSEGKEMAEKDRGQHHRLKEHLKRFQNMRSSDPDYIPQIQALYADLQQHIKEEEHDDLPALEKALVRDTENKGVSETLAKTFERTKMFVPSRSHPSAGEKPAFESVMGLLSAPVDKLADMLRKFPK
ncbi:unnamed protein product [Periconia digitata]|uniref:Hemerythrin-like domain-containing protein n=1 Tax=Periconia digitata TaxID=1303443 RepID=A0A9W4U5B3_9PLEO|nr:unnamed protein product [Periconia digitata]